MNEEKLPDNLELEQMTPEASGEASAIEENETEKALNTLAGLHEKIKGELVKNPDLSENTEVEKLLEECEAPFEKLTDLNLEKVSNEDAHAYFEHHKKQKVYGIGKEKFKEFKERVKDLYRTINEAKKDKGVKVPRKDIKLYNYIENAWDNLSDEEKKEYAGENDPEGKGAKFNFIVDLAKKRFKNIKLDHKKYNVENALADQSDSPMSLDNFETSEEVDRKFIDSYVFDEGDKPKQREKKNTDQDEAKKRVKELQDMSFDEPEKSKPQKNKFNESERQAKEENEEYADAGIFGKLRIEARDTIGRRKDETTGKYFKRQGSQWIEDIKETGRIISYPVRTAWSLIRHPIKFWSKPKQEEKFSPEELQQPIEEPIIDLQVKKVEQKTPPPLPKMPPPLPLRSLPDKGNLDKKLDSLERQGEEIKEKFEQAEIDLKDLLGKADTSLPETKPQQRIKIENLETPNQEALKPAQSSAPAQPEAGVNREKFGPVEILQILNLQNKDKLSCGDILNAMENFSSDNEEDAKTIDNLSEVMINNIPGGASIEKTRQSMEQFIENFFGDLIKKEKTPEEIKREQELKDEESINSILSQVEEMREEVKALKKLKKPVRDDLFEQLDIIDHEGVNKMARLKLRKSEEWKDVKNRIEEDISTLGQLIAGHKKRNI